MSKSEADPQPEPVVEGSLGRGGGANSRAGLLLHSNTTPDRTRATLVETEAKNLQNMDASHFVDPHELPVATYDPEVIERYLMHTILGDTKDENVRYRLAACKMLGDMTAVGAFTKRSEVKVSDESVENLENILQKKLERILGRTIEGSVVDE